MKLTCPECGWTNFYWCGTIFAQYYLLQCTKCKTVHIHDPGSEKKAEELFNSPNLIPKKDIIVGEEQ